MEFTDLTGDERIEFFNQHTMLGSRGIDLQNELDRTATDEFLDEDARADRVQNINAALVETAATVISPASARAAVTARQAAQ